MPISIAYVLIVLMILTGGLAIFFQANGLSKKIENVFWVSFEVFSLIAFVYSCVGLIYYILTF